MNVSNSSGVPPAGSRPSPANFSLSAGDISALFISALSLATMSFGIPRGPITPAQVITSKPVTPASATVGNSGTAGERLGPVTASPRTLPALTWGTIAGMLSNSRSICPATKPVIACCASLYGTCTICAPVISLNNSMPTWGLVPLPGNLLYGSPGNGTSPHVGMELFKLMTGAQMVHVPYKDAQQAITGLVAGQIDLLFDNMPAIVPHVRAGRVRGLAVTGPRRSPAVPELPTVAEAGVTGFEVITWAGVIGPRGIPKDIVARLNAEINSALMSPALKEKFAGLGLEPAGGTPEEFDTFIKKRGREVGR